MQARERRTYESLPDAIKYQDDHESYEQPFNTFFVRLLMHLEHLQTAFYAERLLARHDGGSADSSGLLAVSFELVRHAIVFWMHRDRFQGSRLDFVWMVRLSCSPALPVFG